MSVTVRRSASLVLAAAALIACNSAPVEQAETSEQAAVADIDHMIRRGDGTFDVYCVDGTIERNVPASKIVANDVCNSAPSCPSPVPETAPVWNPPGPPQNACTGADLALFQQLLQSPGATLPAIEGALYSASPDCAQCIFSHESDTRWGPIVYVGTSGDGFVNWGACFALAPNGSDACGDAFHKTHECSIAVCSSCTTDAEFASCYNTSFADANSCGQYDVSGSCGPSYGTIDQACMDFMSIVRLACGG